MNLREFTIRFPHYFRRIGASLATLIVTLLLTSAVDSQALYGTLVGRVEDQTGAVVFGARRGASVPLRSETLFFTVRLNSARRL